MSKIVLKPVVIGVILILIAAVLSVFILANYKSTGSFPFFGKTTKKQACSMPTKTCRDGSVARVNSGTCEYEPCVEEQSCVREGEGISTMPLPNGAERPKCCEGLSTIPIDTNVVDAGYCTKCGDKLCKVPENGRNCPADCGGGIVGNDRDEHDCIGSAGYTWCEEKQKCLRSWEESCSKEIWKSEAQGDLISDQRDSEDVCQDLQKRENLTNCQLLISKTSNDPSECVDGSSIAGCFACKFLCQ